MEGKKVKDSSITTSIIMMPEDANPAGNVHGGIIMKHVDETAGIVAFFPSPPNPLSPKIRRQFAKAANLNRPNFWGEGEQISHLHKWSFI